MTTSPGPNWTRIREIAAEMERLIAAGEWNEAAFKRLRDQAYAASNGAPVLEFLYNEAEPSWREE